MLEAADVGMWEGANVGRAPAAGGFCPAFAGSRMCGRIGPATSRTCGIAQGCSLG